MCNGGTIFVIFSLCHLVYDFFSFLLQSFSREGWSVKPVIPRDREVRIKEGSRIQMEKDTLC